MTSTLSSGNLGRWFEELCRIKHETLRQCVADGDERLRAGCLSHYGGVYAFWWTGPPEDLAPPECNRMLEVKGPGERTIQIRIEDDWLGIKTNLPIPLYVGKTTDLAKRIGGHLRLSSEGKILSPVTDNRKAPRPTTNCQLRAGVEHLFPFELDSRSFIIKKIGLSYVSLDGDNYAVDRFYLEDLAIGLMHPILNVDVER